MGGKVLVSTQEHIDRLVAARLASDILGTDLIIVARTDAEAATLLDSNIDFRDHPFILGVTVPGLPTLNEALHQASITGKGVDQVSKDWTARACLMTFGEAVLSKIRSLNLSHSQKGSMEQMWFASKPESLSMAMAKSTADKIFGVDDAVFFDWESCRVREGYYQIKCGIDYCIQRAKAYSPYSDLVSSVSLCYMFDVLSRSSILFVVFSVLSDLDGDQDSRFIRCPEILRRCYEALSGSDACLQS
jgi:isocitrate lyase